MCACDFDIMFTFFYVSWDWTMNDARVLLDALTRPKVHFPWSSRGKYYLVDSCYPCTSEFLPPYWDKWYH